MSGARRTRQHPRAGALPETISFRIGELSTPPLHLLLYQCLFDSLVRS